MELELELWGRCGLCDIAGRALGTSLPDLLNHYRLLHPDTELTEVSALEIDERFEKQKGRDRSGSVAGREMPALQESLRPLRGRTRATRSELYLGPETKPAEATEETR